MPSSLALNGLKLYRPAVYATVDASALGGSSASAGNVCVVGNFSAFEQGSALTFTSAQALSRYDHSDRELAHMGKVAFAPSLDERIPAGANTLTVLNVAPTTQAELSLVDSEDAPALTLKSTVWGPKGNRTQVSVSNVDTDKVTLEIVRDGLSESFEAISSGDVASMYYGGSLLDSVGFGGDRVNGLSYEWSQSEAMSSGEATFSVSDMVSDGALSVSLSTTAHTDTVTVAITGADLAGASASATLTFVAGQGDAQVTSAFGRIDSVSAVSDDNSYAGSVVVEGSVSFAPSSYASLREMWSAIDQLPSVTATYLAAREYDADAFDAETSADVSGSGNALSFRCDLQEIIEALSASTLVTAERPALGTLSLAEQDSGSSVSMLTGGSVTAPSLSDWTSALQSIESADLQIIVAWSSEANVHAEIAVHLRAAALAGRERNAWVGAAANESLSALNTRAKALNNRNIALVGQQVRLTAPTGEALTRDPMWLALLMAGMQAGSPIATPLTRKAPNVLDVYSVWDANRDASEAIRSGVCALSRGPLGWRVERSVTTWLRDDNPIYSEVSANESVNASVRDLRAGLDGFIGEPNRSLTANRIKSIVEARLNRQVLDGTIKGFRNVVLEDLGDTLRVNYEVAAVEPLNFISVTASVVRF
jgi:hypothetical protein